MNGSRTAARLWHGSLALVMLASWIGYTLAHGAVTGWYPYPYPYVSVADLGYAVAVRNLVFVVVFAVVLRRLDQRLGAAHHDRASSPSAQ